MGLLIIIRKSLTSNQEIGKTDFGSVSYFTEHVFNRKMITKEKKTVNLVYCDFKELYTIFNIVKGSVFEHLMEDFYHIVENIVYKHKASIDFSEKINDSIPVESWYKEKWLNWTLETINLEPATKHIDRISKAEPYDMPADMRKFMDENPVKNT